MNHLIATLNFLCITPHTWRYLQPSLLTIIFLILSNTGCVATDAEHKEKKEQPQGIFKPSISSPMDVNDLSNQTNLSNASCAINGEEGIEKEILQQINKIRESGRYCGVTYFGATSQLTWDTNLQKTAHIHAAQMAQSNVISHTGIDSRGLGDRFSTIGYPFHKAGENITAGPKTIEGAMKAWVDSPSHCAALMEPDYDEVGVACVRKKTSFYQFYWTMNLAKKKKMDASQSSKVITGNSRSDRK